MGVLGDFGPLNVIIHHRDPQKVNHRINPRLLSYICKNLLRGLICRRVHRKCDGHTQRHTHTDTGKFILCPCIAWTDKNNNIKINTNN